MHLKSTLSNRIGASTFAKGGLREWAEASWTSPSYVRCARLLRHAEIPAISEIPFAFFCGNITCVHVPICLKPSPACTVRR
ncbi:hypothetical protein Plhal304r1_c006g0026701 [Plasmopara halstedii]